LHTATDILVGQAINGNKDALEEVIRRIQDYIYNLALRMLWHPADAEDATQEILIKIITHLDNFRGESAFTSWVYRIATNHLLTFKKCQIEREITTFKDFEETIDREISASSPATTFEPEQSLIVQEIMIGCTMGMLICLNRNLRIAYILGDIFEMESDNAAYILTITPSTFRKRLSRARRLLKDFMQKKCGLINPDNPCHCARYVDFVVSTRGRDPERLLFAGHPCRGRKELVTAEQLQEMSELEHVIALFRSHPDYAAPEKFVSGIKELVDSGKFSILK